METIEVTTKKWGNSLGIIIPKDIVEKQHIKENGTLRVLIVPSAKKALHETFGMFKGKLKKSGQQWKDEIRSDLYE